MSVATGASLMAGLQPQDWVSLLDMALADSVQAGSVEQFAAEDATASVAGGQAGTAQRSRTAHADAQAAIHASGLTLFTKLLTVPAAQAAFTDEARQSCADPGATAVTWACHARNVVARVDRTPPSAVHASKSLGLADAPDSVHELYSKALAEAMDAHPALHGLILSQLVLEEC